MSDELCPPPVDDDDLTLPRASINKMIKELVPNIRVANESRELIMNCCTEFIHLISSEANEICKQNNKKTINADHVLVALEQLGFPDYMENANAVLNDCKEVAANRRRNNNRLENLGIPEEELLRQQEELFAKARQEQAALDQANMLALNMNLSAGHTLAAAAPPPSAAPSYLMLAGHFPKVEDTDDDDELE